MPLVLWFYIGGMTAALVVGLIFYAVIGTQTTPLLQSIFGRAAGHVWGRAFRMLLVLTAVLGGLSTRWYGCSYSDHQAVSQSPRLMAAKTTDQISQATLHVTRLVVVAAAIGAVVFAALQSGPLSPKAGK